MKSLALKNRDKQNIHDRYLGSLNVQENIHKTTLNFKDIFWQSQIFKRYFQQIGKVPHILSIQPVLANLCHIGKRL